MNKLYSLTSLIHRKKSTLDNGFTLIELLVVVIIVGILAAIAVPNSIRQIAKAREAEGKNNLGILSRAQQAYHFENSTFTTSVSNLLGGSSIQSSYYSFPDPIVATSGIVKHQAIARNPTADQIKNYSMGVYFSAGFYDAAVCESSSVGAVVDVPNNVVDSCSNSGLRIR